MYRTGLGIPLLHLLFYAVIVTNFVCALISSTVNDNIKDSNKDKKEYDYQQNKHYSENENETYHSDKRLIIEEYYRQSAISVTNFRDNFNVNLHKNHSSKYNNVNAENTVVDNDDLVLNDNDTTLNSNNKHTGNSTIHLMRFWTLTNNHNQFKNLCFLKFVSLMFFI